MREERGRRRGKKGDKRRRERGSFCCTATEVELIWLHRNRG